MKKKRPYLVNSIVMILVMGLVTPALQAEETVFTVDADTWSRPRSAAMVQGLPAVQSLMSIWLEHQDALIELRYPGGEEGSLWAKEMSDWLVSLGVPSARIETHPGHPVVDELALVIAP